MSSVRAVAKLDRGRMVSTAMRATGVPAPLTRAAYRATAWNRELTRPLFVAGNIAHTESLAKMESIDRFMAAMPGYPGRFYAQLWERLVLANDIGRGGLRLRNRWIALSKVHAPVLLIGGTEDVITPAASVAAGARSLTGAPFVRYDTVPGGHLGILTGETARDSTWAHLEKFLAEVS